MQSKYILSFVANIPALGLAKYQIKRDENAKSSLATTVVHNSQRSFQKYVVFLYLKILENLSILYHSYCKVWHGLGVIYLRLFMILDMLLSSKILETQFLVKLFEKRTNFQNVLENSWKTSGI